MIFYFLLNLLIRFPKFLNYSRGIKKRPFLTYVEMCFYLTILECAYEGVSFVFADKFTNILTILLDKYTTINFCTIQ